MIKRYDLLAERKKRAEAKELGPVKKSFLPQVNQGFKERFLSPKKRFLDYIEKDNPHQKRRR